MSRLLRDPTLVAEAFQYLLTVRNTVTGVLNTTIFKGQTVHAVAAGFQSNTTVLAMMG